MLLAILRNVATSDLINCRQVDRKWNEISSQIMRQRADIQIEFSFQSGQLLRSIQHYPHDSLLGSFSTTMSLSKAFGLSDLVGCLKQSKHFPFSSFRFKDLGTDFRDDFERFLSIWGENIYELTVKIDVATNNAIMTAEMLRVLLFEKTPELKRLGIEFSIDWLFVQNEKSPVRLFTGTDEFKLPKLNELRVQCVFDKFSGIVEDILGAAPNLKLFEKCLLDSRILECITAKELAILQSLDKLHCLENVSLMFKEDVVTCLENSPQIMDLQFKSIELPVDWLEQGDQQLCIRATKLISKIFDSSMDSLKTLRIPPLGWLSGLVLPKFKNLQKLILSQDEGESDEEEVYCMFPPLFDMADSFPNLQQLSKRLF